VNWFPPYHYILASKSPRRIQLLSELGLPFTVKSLEMPEDFPANLGMSEIPVFLALQKALPFEGLLQPADLLITADTIVWLEGEVLGKPAGSAEARIMLQKLSGKVHQVITGVCLKNPLKESCFYEVTDVEFKVLTSSEINYYLENFNPVDKAGAYGIQEWIGLAGITRIAGSYHNVVGLPVQRLYSEILAF
jgi:septum formation protein